MQLNGRNCPGRGAGAGPLQQMEEKIIYIPLIFFSKMTEAVTIQDVHEEIKFIAEKISKMEVTMQEIDYDLHRQVKPEYLEKLERIKKEKAYHFETKEEFLHFLENEI